MRSIAVLSLLLGLARARPQDIAMDDIYALAIPTEGPAITATAVADAFDQATADAAASAAVTNTPTATPTTAAKLARRDAEILEKRGVNDPCAPQPVGLGYKTLSPDTDQGFESDPYYSYRSKSAVTPYGYKQTFKNLQGSTAYGTFLQLITLTSYDPEQCAHLCDQNSDGCTSFNLYYERDPSVNPAAACPNPSSITNVKCTLWKSTTQSPEGAVNLGQYREQFHVVIAGSNGYLKDAPPPSYNGYDGPIEEGCAINAPLAADGSDTYLGYKFFPAGDYSQCTAACTAQTKYDAAHPDKQGCYKPCNFVNAYVLSIDGLSAGIYCSMYSQVWDRSYATNCGQSRKYGFLTVRFDVASSYAYAKNPQDQTLTTCKSTGALGAGEH